MIPISDEQAKAVTATADTTGKLADLVGKAGSFCARLVGQVPEQLGGIATDWATYLRCSNLLIIQDMVDAKMKMRAFEGKPVPIRLRLAYPMLEAASLENDDTLQGLWANLIANAMDPNYSDAIHPAYIGIIKELSVDEALILQYLARLDTFPMSYLPNYKRPNIPIAQIYQEFLASVPLKRRNSIATAFDNLTRLQLLEIRNVFAFEGQEVRITDFGKSFIGCAISPT